MLLISLFVLAACIRGAMPVITGGVQDYQIAQGDSLVSIAARFGVDANVLARDNALRVNARIHPGDRLIVDNRHIAPVPRPRAIVLNVPQRMLFVFDEGRPVKAFPVAVGRLDWRTPLGTFEIAVKEIDPVWDVPVSIQGEMAKKGQPILTKVAPGPANPLGNRWLGLTASGVGIHGTNQPTSIYRFTTHGCIRVHPDDMMELFELAEVGMPVVIEYEPVLLARLEDGTTLLEVHRDIYRKAGPLDARVNRILRDAGLDELVGSPGVRRAISEQAGRPVTVTH
jgi:L,D-transpeptidase ErfK/SrfK